MCVEGILKSTVKNIYNGSPLNIRVFLKLEVVVTKQIALEKKQCECCPDCSVSSLDRIHTVSEQDSHGFPNQPCPNIHGYCVVPFDSR